jgi:serine phosphatase RsbU (regulator of sigma subunit)
MKAAMSARRSAHQSTTRAGARPTDSAGSASADRIRSRSIPGRDQPVRDESHTGASSRKMSQGDIAFFASFGVYTALVLLWLIAGLAAAISVLLPSVEGALKAWGEGTDFFASVARVITQAAVEVHDRAALPFTIDLGFVVAVDYFFSAVGIGLALLIIWLRPRELAARLLAVGMIGVAASYNDLSHVILTPLPDWVDWPGPHFILHVVAGAAFATALLVFPDGHLRPAWARWPLAAIYAFVVLISTLIDDFLSFFILFFGLLLPVVGITSQVSRLRNADSSQDRQQSRLLLWALGIACVPGVLYVLVDVTVGLDTPQIHLVFRIFQPVLAIIPIALTVGLLRYRLWDMDRVINRALVYALLTGALAALYLVTVLILGNWIFADPAAALVSTVAAAALFSPARRRVQDFIDRRFYRERHNATQTLNAFAERLHQEVDLDSLIDELLAVVSKTIQPRRASLWLRSAPRAQGLERAVVGSEEPELKNEEDPVTFLVFETVASTKRRGTPRRHPQEEQIRVSGELVSVSTDDPLIAYFEQNAEAAHIEGLNLASPALATIRSGGTVLAQPLVTHRELIGFLNLGPRLSGRPYSEDDKKLLASLASQAASAVRVAQLLRQQAQEVTSRERLAQELRVAQMIQQQFLPTQLPRPANWIVSAYYHPARFVGGDFYDFIELEDGTIGVVVGDVTGKGVPSALVMAHTHGVLREGARRMQTPGEVLAYANDVLLPEMPANMFVTCAYAVLDPATGRLRLANAGHCLPCLWGDGSIAELRATGMPLGLMPAMTYQETKTTLQPGHQILFHSDGLTEAHDPKGEMFGTPRLLTRVRDTAGADEAIEFLRAELQTFTGPDWEQEDDITLVALEWSEDLAGRRLDDQSLERRGPR